jgi:hypothetical protein
VNEDKIMKTYFVALTTLLLVSLPNGGKAQGNLVFNGGFDTSTTGWMTTNVFGSGYESAQGNPPGDLLLDGLSSPSTASQTITSLTPVAIYVVSGDYRKVGGKVFTDYTFGVALDGIFLFRTADPGNFNWQSFSFQYTATSSSVLLSLSSKISGSDFAYAIDNISMQPVPEPSSFWLMGVGGMVGVMFCRNRTKRLL